MNPSITIIAPSYNHENYIEECLESIFIQTSKKYDLDLILIDDASKDQTTDIIHKNISKNNHHLRDIKFIKNKINRGAHENYNMGIKLANSDLIHFMNTDDCLGKNRISSTVKSYINYKNKFDIIDGDFFWGFGKVNLVNENSEYIEADGFWQYLTNIIDFASNRYPTLSFHLLKDNLSISTGNIFCSTKFAKLLGGFKNYKYVHDWDFCLRSILFSEPYLLDEVDSEYIYRHHPTNSFKSLGYIGEIESWDILYRYYLNSLLRSPRNTSTLSPSNYGYNLFAGFLEENPDHKNIVSKILGDKVIGIFS